MAKTRKNINKNSKIENMILKFFTFSNSIKLYHWKTANYNTHIITNDLLNSMNNHIDKFTENYLGMNNINKKSKMIDFNKINCVTLKVFSNNKDIENYLLAFKKQIIDNIKDRDGYSLVVIRDDMLLDINKFLYLLRLR